MSSPSKRARMPDIVGKEYSCTTHYDSITKSPSYDSAEGQYGRKPLPFAIAEKIDNAVAATMNNKGPRNVDLYFLYNERNELQNIVIRDNGKGMDLVETRAYATYCYSKRRQREDREGGDSKEEEAEEEESSRGGPHPRYSINGKIGQYGVGAQNAAFYLGGVEHVMTCPAPLKEQKVSDLLVTDVVISRSGLKERWEKEQKTTYDYTFYSRRVGETSLLDKETETHPILKEVIGEREEAELSEENGFSMMVISKIKKIHKKRLNPCFTPSTADDFKRILHENVLADLARIYHYYIHGVNGDENLPDEVGMGVDDDSDDDDDDSSVRHCKKKRKKGSSSGHKSAKKGRRDDAADSEQVDIGVNIVIHAYRGKEIVFKSSLQDVSTVEVELMYKRKDELPLYLKIHPEEGKGKKACKFSMYLYYCPFILERETRPADAYEQTPDKPIENRPIISCYWQGRWVPYADIYLSSEDRHRLEIFESAPKELLKRIRGTVFFSKNMKPNNSKLWFNEVATNLLNVKEGKNSLEYFANWSDESSVTTSMTRVKKKVKDWIEDCHARLDREISVIGEPDGDFKDLEGNSETRFSKMGYGKDDDGRDIVFSKGDKIMFPNKPRRFGIVEFFACAKLEKGRAATARAWVAYKRYPTLLYGEGNLIRDQVSVKLESIQDGSWWDAQVKKIEDRVPTELLVFSMPADAGQTSVFKRSLFEPKNYDKKLEKSQLIAGYDLPDIHVFAANSSGTPLTEVPNTKDDKKTKIKILRRVTKIWCDAHARANNGNGKLPKPEILTSTSTTINCENCQDAPEKVGSYFFPKMQRLFEGAGEYEIAFIVIGNSDLKELKWSKTVKIGPADPSVAEIDLAHSENAPDELRLGVKKKSIRAAFHDKFKDDQASGSYKNLMKGNLIEFFPANVRVEAINVCPTNLQVIFDSDSVEPIKDEPGYAYLWVVVKPVSSEDRSANIKQLLKAKPTPVNGKCSIMFHFEQGKRKFSIESHQQFEFKLSAGLPKKLELEDKGISYAGISCENHGLLPEFVLRAKDKYNYPVSLEDGERIDIKAKLTYTGTKSSCRNRKQIEFETKMTETSVTMGGKLIHLADPLVTEREGHELKISGIANLTGKVKKEMKCSSISVTLLPSSMPHSARPFHVELGQLKKNDHGHFVVDVEAGSEINGIYFELFDEADRGVTDLSKWKVKWPGTGKWLKLDHGMVMPSKRAREKANDPTPLVVAFTGNADGHEKDFTVDLTLVPYPSAPAKWYLCNASNGKPLPDNLSIACDQLLQNLIGIQLRDKYENVINTRNIRGNSGAEQNQVISPKVAIHDDKVTGPNKEVVKQGNWKEFIPWESSDGSHTLHFQSDCSLRNAIGVWKFVVKTDVSNYLGDVKIDCGSHTFSMTAGPPSYMQVTLKGLPYEISDKSSTPHVFYGNADAQPTSMGMVFPVETLREFPSTSVIQRIEVVFLDESGNVVNKQAIERAQKKASVSLSLSGGRVGEGKQRNLEQLLKRFGSNTVVFNKVLVAANCDNSAGMLVTTGAIVVACGIDSIPVEKREVVIPVKFSQMNRVLSVKLLPDPYTESFRIGENPSQIIVKIQTEDGAQIELQKYEESICIQCTAMDHLFEEEGIFIFEREQIEGGNESNAKIHPKAANTFYFSPGNKMLRRRGRHEIVVTYKELRPSIKDIIGDYETKSNVLHFNVLSGRPHVLDFAIEMRLSLQSNGAAQRVTNSEENGKVNSRKILKTPLNLFVRDEENNQCDDTSDLCVVATIEPDESQYEQTSDIVCFTQFSFDNDSQRHETRDRLKKKFASELEKWNSCNNEALGKKKKLDDMEERLGKAEENLKMKKSILASLGLDPRNYPGSNECQDSINEISHHGRPVGRRAYQVDSRMRHVTERAREVYGKDEVYGLLVELVCVEEDQLAKIIGHYSKKWMETLVVKKLSTQMDMAQHNAFQQFQVISLETAKKWNQETQPRGDKHILMFERNRHFQWKNEFSVTNVIDFHDPDHEFMRKSVVYSALQDYCIVPFSFRECGQKMKDARNHNVTMPDVIDQNEGRIWRKSGVTGGSRRQVDTQNWGQTYPGQKDNSHRQLQALHDVQKAFLDCEAKKDELSKTKPTADENHKQQRDMNDAKARVNSARVEYQAAQHHRASSMGAGGNLLVSAEHEKPVPPQLDFVGAAPSRLQGAHEKLGPFVFGVSSDGSATLENLGLKIGVGNHETDYQLKCRLHSKKSGEPLQRRAPAEKPPVAHLEDDD